MCAQNRSLYNEYFFPRKNCFPGNCVQRNFWFEKFSWTFKVFRTLSEEIFDFEREKFDKVVKTAF